MAFLKLAVILIGALILGLSFGGAEGYGPLASVAFQNTTLSNPNVACTLQNSCTATVQILNANATSAGQFGYGGGYLTTFDLTFKLVATSTGQTTNIFTQSAIGGQQQQFTVTQAFGTLQAGSYTLYVSATAPDGVPIGAPINYQFNTSYQISMQSSPAGCSVSPSGTTYYQAGTVVQLQWIVTNAATCAQPQWEIQPVGLGGTQNIAQLIQSTQNPYPLTMNSNFVVSLASQNPQSYSTSITAYMQNSAFGSVSPSSAIIYSSSVAGPTSATFTATLNQGYSFFCWEVTESGQCYQGNPLTISYGQLTNNGQNALSQYHIVGLANAGPVLQILDNPNYPGKVTINPAVGSYVETQGSVVQITASNIATGYVFGGWSVDGAQPTSQALSITITMDTAHLVFPIITPLNPGGGVGGGSGGACTASGTNAAVSITVIRANDSKPISGASVSISGVGGGAVTTGANGVACIQNVAIPGGNILNGYTGSVTVTVSANGFTTVNQKVAVQGGQTSSALVTLKNGFGLNGPLWMYGIFVGAAIVAVGAFLPGDLGEKEGGQGKH